MNANSHCLGQPAPSAQCRRRWGPRLAVLGLLIGGASLLFQQRASAPGRWPQASSWSIPAVSAPPVASTHVVPPPARLEAAGDRFAIQVADAGAHHPVTVDPLTTSLKGAFPEKRRESSGQVNSLSLAGDPAHLNTRHWIGPKPYRDCHFGLVQHLSGASWPAHRGNSARLSVRRRLPPAYVTIEAL